MNEGETLLAKAEELAASGEDSNAMDALTRILCIETSEEIKQRAHALFIRLFKSSEEPVTDSANGSLSPSIPDQPISTPLASPSAQNFAVAKPKKLPILRAPKAADQSIPTKRMSGEKFSAHVMRFLKISYSKIKIPGETVGHIRNIGDAIAALDNDATKDDVIAILTSALEELSATAIGLNALGAVTSVLYADGFLDTARVKHFNETWNIPANETGTGE